MILKQEHVAQYGRSYTKPIVSIEDDKRVLVIAYCDLELIWNLMLGNWNFKEEDCQNYSLMYKTSLNVEHVERSAIRAESYEADMCGIWLRA